MSDISCYAIEGMSTLNDPQMRNQNCMYLIENSIYSIDARFAKHSNQMTMYLIHCNFQFNVFKKKLIH